jgi:sodium/potassium-transporting ATPase subunit beta
MYNCASSASFLIVYKNPGTVPVDGKNIAHCNYESSPGDKVCYVDPKEWRTCSSEYNYNYPRSAPCIFLKLNKVSQKSSFK